MARIPEGYKVDVQYSSRFVQDAVEQMRRNKFGERPPAVSGVIGFCGPAGVGKDTAVALLEHYLSAHSFAVRRDSFAAPLYEVISVLTGIPVYVLQDRRYKEIPLTWPGAPEGLDTWTPRKLLQWMGTEIVRNQLDQEFWVKRFIERARDRNINLIDGVLPLHRGVITLVSDIRYENEAKACDLVVELDRVGIEYTGEHTSAIRLPESAIDHVASIGPDTNYSVFGYTLMDRLEAQLV